MAARTSATISWFLIVGFALRTATADISFPSIQQIIGFPEECTAAYNTPVSNCDYDDLPGITTDGSGTCSNACRTSLQAAQLSVQRACESKSAGEDTIIGLLFAGDAVSFFCTPPPGASNTADATSSVTSTETTTQSETTGSSASSASATDSSTTSEERSASTEAQTTSTSGSVTASTSVSTTLSTSRTSTSTGPTATAASGNDGGPGSGGGSPFDSVNVNAGAPTVANARILLVFLGLTMMGLS